MNGGREAVLGAANVVEEPWRAIGGRTLQKRLVFDHPDEREQFTEFMRLVRGQIEVFVEPPKTKKRCRGNAAEAGTGGEGTPTAAGDGGGLVSLELCAEERVGIRCVHCRGKGRVEGSTRSAAVYPTTTRLAYQSVRNYQRHHMIDCPCLPADVRDRLVALKGAATQTRSRGTTTGALWERSCARLGLVDAEDGQLRLRKAVMEGTWTDAMGKEAMARVSDEAAAVARSKTRGKAKGKGKPVEEETSGRTETKPGAACKGGTSGSSSKKPLSFEPQRANNNGGAITTLSDRLLHSSSPAVALGAVASQPEPADDPYFSPRSEESSAVVESKQGNESTTTSSGSAAEEDIAELSPIIFPLGLPPTFQQEGEEIDDFDALFDLVDNATAVSSPLVAEKSKPDATTELHGLVRPPEQRATTQEVGNSGSAELKSHQTAFVQQNHYASPPTLKQEGEEIDNFDALFDLDTTTAVSSPALLETFTQDAAELHSLVLPPEQRATSQEVGNSVSTELKSHQTAFVQQNHNETTDASPASSLQTTLGYHSGPFPSQRRDNGNVTSQVALGLQHHPSVTVGPCEHTAKSATIPLVHIPSESPLQSVPPRDDCSNGYSRISPALGGSSMDNALAPSLAQANGAAVPKEAVLKRMDLALGIVQAAAEIRQLPTGIAEPALLDGGRKDRENLRILGSELYELFADRRPCDFVAEPSGTPAQVWRDDEEDPDESRQQTKRGRPLERAAGRTFVPLAELGFPSALCGLVSSLLETQSSNSKSFRSYDTAFAEVQEDLQLMMDNPTKFLFGSTNTIGFFELQQLDIREDALYGRDEQVSKLMEAFAHVTAPTSNGGRSGMVLISGSSGSGKSTLVRKVQRDFVQRGARFVSGKFDVMQQLQPLSAIMNALNEYCDLLAHDTGCVDSNRLAVAAALGSEGRVLANLIPNLCKVLPGVLDGPPSAIVTGREAQHRLEFLVRMLLRSTSSNNRPIVLFLDDLQWADVSSLELIRSLVTDATLDKLMFIGCYRDNKVRQGHPLLETLDTIQRYSNTPITSMCTGNLDMASVNELVSNALHAFPRTTRSLSEAVLQKTCGNALFVVQFLISLRDEGLLQYSLSTRKWEWDIESIRARKIANGAVADLMTTKLLRLAPEVHEAVRIAAAFGSQCLEKILQIVDKDPCRLGGTVAALDIAVAEGLLAKVEEGPAYRFCHDQIQSAAYMLIAESERESFHLQIGRSLWHQSSAEELGTYLYVICDQMYRGAGCISDCAEKLRLAQLSLTAGKKAAATSAFLPASVYLKSGIGLIVENDWEWQRELCFELHNLCAEMEYVLGNFDAVNTHVGVVLRRKRSMREKLRIYFTLTQSCGCQGHLIDAFANSVAILGELGEKIPPECTELQIQRELMETQKRLGTRTEDELLKTKTMTDPDKKEAMKFYHLLSMYTYTGERREYFPLIACRMVQLSLSYGLCKESAVGFAAHGISICGLLGDTAGAFRLGHLSTSIIERFQAKEYLTTVLVVVYGFINPWIEPIQSSLPCLKRAYDVGLSTGNTEYAMANAQCYQGAALASGKPLGQLVKEMNQYATQMQELKQELLFSANQPLRQFALNLLGKSADPLKLVGEVMNEGALLSLAEEEGRANLSSIVYFYRMWLEVLFGEYERAAETAGKNKNVETDNLARFPIVCNHSFYYGLTALVLARKQGRSKWEDTIDTTMSKMRKWTLSAPWNCQHKLELMNAEFAYLEGDIAAAAEAFDCAVATASMHRFVHEEALALERAGIFYMENSQHSTASTLFKRSHNCYVQWGAHSKAAQVKLYI